MFTQFDETDTRLDATFMGSYRYKDEENKTGFYLNGVHTIKILVISMQQEIVSCAVITFLSPTMGLFIISRNS